MTDVFIKTKTLDTYKVAREDNVKRHEEKLPIYKLRRDV